MSKCAHVLYPLELAPDSGDAALYAVSLSKIYHAKLTLLKVFEDMVPSAEEKAQVQEPVRHWMDDYAGAIGSTRAHPL